MKTKVYKAGGSFKIEHFEVIKLLQRSGLRSKPIQQVTGWSSGTVFYAMSAATYEDYLANRAELAAAKHLKKAPTLKTIEVWEASATLNAMNNKLNKILELLTGGTENEDQSKNDN